MGILNSATLERMVNTFRDIGLDGRGKFASARELAERAGSSRSTEQAIGDVVAKSRRGVTAGGFLTGLGGLVTMPALLPANILEFYVQATRMVGAIATLRGYDVNDDEVRARVLAALVEEESGDILDNVGLGVIAGAASKQVAKRLPKETMSNVSVAIGARVLRRFGIRSIPILGKAIPGFGGIVGAVSDRLLLNRIAKSAKKAFPAKR